MIKNSILETVGQTPVVKINNLGSEDVYVKIESFNPLSSAKDRLAMVCAPKGYSLVIVMVENFSEERRKLLWFLGAKVVLTPASTKVIVAEPDNIQILKSGAPQPDKPLTSHPHARPHPIQG